MAEERTDYDPFDAAVLADPAPAHRWLRERCPVHRYNGFEPPFYTLSRHDDVVAALKDIGTFSSVGGQGPFWSDAVALFNDPPEHTVFRRLVNRSFTPRAVAANDAMITTLAAHLVATMAEAPGRRADLHDAVAMPLPTTVIARLLGVEEDLLETFKRWSDAQVAGMGGGDQELRLQYQREMHRYFREQMARRHALVEAGRPLPDDLVSELVAASLDEERPITETELLSLLVQLLVGGNETTTSLITNCVWRLLADRALWEQVVADPSLVEVAVEESLRYDPPVLGLYRNTACPARLHDVDIPERSKVMVLYASANRDPAVWDDPDTFRLDRDLAALRHHLSFGLGLHLCPGAALARLEATRALHALVTQLPGLALEGEVTRIEPFFLWGRRTLPVRW